MQCPTYLLIDMRSASYLNINIPHHAHAVCLILAIIVELNVGGGAPMKFSYAVISVA